VDAADAHHSKSTASVASSAFSATSSVVSVSAVSSVVSSVVSAASSLASSGHATSVISSAQSSASVVSSAVLSSITSAPVSSAASSLRRSSSGSMSGSRSGSRSGSATASGNATATFSAPPSYSSPAQTHPGGPAALFQTAYTVSFTVQNTGGYDGNEVAQLYLSFPEGLDEPPRVLRGFERVFIQKGQRSTVTLPLRTKDISVWNVVSQKWEVPHGTFKVSVGSSSRKLHLETTFNV
jgi:beta-glucosidase